MIAGRSLAYEPLLGEFDRTRPFVKAMVALVPEGTQPALLHAPTGYSIDFYWPTPLLRDPARALDAEFVLADLKRLPELIGPFEVLGVWRLADPPLELALLRRSS